MLGEEYCINLKGLDHNVDKFTVFLFSIRVIHVEEFGRRRVRLLAVLMETFAH